jgi:transcriptional regulator with GAF, ATPase, and Fis domain
MSTNSSRSTALLEVAEVVCDLQHLLDHAETALPHLTESAAKLIPGAECAGITLVRRKGGPESAAASHRFAVLLDEVQRLHREGPAISAVDEDEIIRIDDLAAAERWPRYRDDAIRLTPIRSIMSVRFAIDSKSAGALTFYSERPAAFDDASVELALVFATHTALVWNIVRRSEQFQCALASRDVIGQAKGMIMERFDTDAGRAFELLKRLSQSSNVPVAQIARQCVEADHPPR